MKLIPVVKSDINLAQITIIVGSSIDINALLISNNKELSYKEIFCSFFTNNEYCNIDFYCYD